MQVFEAGRACKAESRGKSGQDDFSDDVVARNGVLEGL